LNLQFSAFLAMMRSVNKDGRSTMFERKLAKQLKKAASQYPSVTLFGPRQSGKTTLAKTCFPGYAYANLEHLGTRELAATDPDAFFRRFAPPVIVDEVQRVPSIVSQIQVLIDEDRDAAGRFILTGSHQTKLSETVSQSLAGRTSVLTLYPPSIAELGETVRKLPTDELLFRGFMPEIHAKGLDPLDWYRNYVQTYLERDIRQMVNVKDLSLFGRFLVLLAGRVGQLVNASALAGEVGVSATTVSGWISILEASFLVYRLCPWHSNRGKRLVKSPKLYFTEPGLAAHLLGIESPEQLLRDPLRGALFENLAVAEALKQRANAALPPDLWFLRTADGFEIDLLRSSGRTLRPVEIKSAATWHDSFARNVRAFVRDTPGAGFPAVVYDGDDLDLSDGTAVRNIRSFAG
jgi:hypothetical protein